MPISDWLSARENRRYTKVNETEKPVAGADVPDGVWVKCDGCKKIVYEGELAENLRVCPACGFHFDLTAPQRDGRFVLPEQKSATLSGYQQERKEQGRPGAAGVLPQVENVRLERFGAERWLVVQEPPDKVWPVVREFWLERGFLIKQEAPEVGVMETDWAENRAKIPQDLIRQTIGKHHCYPDGFALFLGTMFAPTEDRNAKGKGRDGNQTRPEWVDFYGPLEQRPTGILVLDNPGNFRFPQPVRLHPQIPYFCFAPAVLGSFSIEPGKPYVSRYRFCVHDDKLPPEAAQRLWHDYADPPQVRVVSGK